MKRKSQAAAPISASAWRPHFHRYGWGVLNLPTQGVAVKICGIIREEDALGAIQAGADVLGFNTWPGTKRYINLHENAGWIERLPVLKVALLVNSSLEEARKIANLPWIDALQLHGDEDASYCRAAAALGKPLIKALRARSADSIKQAEQFSTSHLLLDAHVPGAYGGTGTAVDLEVVQSFKKQFPKLTLWLAGGLKAENVTAAVRALRPQVVDVSSGVESETARKDLAKMQAFVNAAKNA